MGPCPLMKFKFKFNQKQKTDENIAAVGLKFVINA